MMFLIRPKSKPSSSPTIASIVIHQVGNVACAFKIWGGWETFLWQVVCKAAWSRVELELWVVNRGNVGDLIGDFWSAIATERK
jgi:hypothetical protein